MQESGRVQVVSGSHKQVIADDHRRHRRKILLGEIGNFLMPALFSGFRIEADQVIVRRLEVKRVVIHRHAAIADVRATLRAPKIVPESVAVARINGPGVIGSGKIENSVHLQYRSTNSDAAKRHRCSGIWRLATNKRRHGWTTTTEAGEASATRFATGSSHDLAFPCEGQVLHIFPIDLGQGAIAAPRIIPRIGRPGIGCALQN